MGRPKTSVLEAPLKGGEEFDLLTGHRRWLKPKPGRVKAAQKTFRRRVRAWERQYLNQWQC